MADLFWSYWDASLRFSVLAVFLLLASPLLKRWLSPKLLCWAWAALIIRLSLPLALPFSGSIFNLSENLRPSSWTDAIRSGVVDAGWGETVIPTMPGQDDFVRSSLIGISWEDALIVAWILGVIFMFGRLMFDVARLHRFFSQATKHDSGRLYDIFKDVRRRFGVNANVPLLVSDEVKTPGIAGIFNPRVVVPRACAENLSDEELRCVFLHELTHYRRGDLLLHHGLMLICFLHWFNPLVWLVMRQFKRTMEQACDADVVDSDGIVDNREYGFTLLRVMKQTKGLVVSPAGALCLLGDRKRGALKERIHLIADDRKKNPFLAAIGLAVFGASFVYAITGEEIMENDAERLFSLTRFSGPSLFIISPVDDAEFDLDPKDYVLESERVKSPQSWVQDIDVSEYGGRDILVRIRYRIEGLGDSRRFWLNVENADGQVISSFDSGNTVSLSPTVFEMEVPIRLALGAKEIVYGMSTAGASTLWVESFDVAAVN